MRTRCNLDCPSGLGGRLVLSDSSLRVSWWSFRGRKVRDISFSNIAATEWWTGREDVNLAVHLKDGSTIAATVPAAGLWKFEIDSRRFQAGTKFERVQTRVQPETVSGDGAVPVMPSGDGASPAIISGDGASASGDGRAHTDVENVHLVARLP